MEEGQKAIGWACKDASGILSPFHFTRRACGESDVSIKILYCGICHTDLHFVKNDLGHALYPLVPGHEIVGEVTQVGPGVQRFRPGDTVGVGCCVRSCRACEQCAGGLECYCPKQVLTYNSLDADGSITLGGYSDSIVVDEHYAVLVPPGIPLAAAGPLLCAGVSTYSPMQYYGLNRPGLRLGIVGLGGLGHVAVQFAKAFGMSVTVISTSPGKEAEARRLGADEFLLSRDEEQMKGAMGTLDGILDTVSSAHPVEPLLGLLKAHGKLIMMGASDKPIQLPLLPLIFGRKLVGGTFTGGIKETQEMLDFAAEHNIAAEVEVIPIDYVNAAMERLAVGDVRYRFVIDIANTLKP